jgi:hypothetical protein
MDQRALHDRKLALVIEGETNASPTPSSMIAFSVLKAGFARRWWRPPLLPSAQRRERTQRVLDAVAS